ncbi:hypothetical protein [Paenibacillus hamazuiensis]|uniref:hypothetical protein n=1 Tax=Paenibacillus hamazuiensis TaxID=2936508 RepID=UPI00200C03F1|nr:hypothetical protein [Paenibacillus hamazuiensis]
MEDRTRNLDMKKVFYQLGLDINKLINTSIESNSTPALKESPALERQSNSHPTASKLESLATDDTNGIDFQV